jgi:AcrR family transcriptional regulator
MNRRVKPPVRRHTVETGTAPGAPGAPGTPGSRKHRYDSTRRREQAQETRRRMLEAASHLFVTRGYAGATIEAIAGEAGVAVETVYAAFRSKRALLATLVQALVRGNGTAVPLLEQAGPQGVRRASNQPAQIRLFAEDITGILGRVALLMDVIRAAAATEPEIGRLLREMQQERLTNLTRFVEWVAATGPLREGVSVASAADTVWTLASPETYRLLTGDRGWTPRRYSAWLADALTHLLLPGAVHPKGSQSADDQAAR